MKIRTMITGTGIFGKMVSLSYAPVKQLKLSGTVRSDIYIQNIESRKGIGGFDVNAFSTGKYQNKEMNYEFLAQYDETFNDFL